MVDLMQQLEDSGLEGDLFQEPLPKPPIPGLEESLRKYEGYVSVIATEDQLEQTKKFIEWFQKYEGPILQKRLVEVAEKVPNWASRYWLNDMYLDVRLPLPLNANPAYIFPRQKFCSIDDVLEYASLLIQTLGDIVDILDKRELQPESVKGTRMCSEQYWRIFTSYRAPGDPRDFQYTNTRQGLSATGNEHVIVLRNSHLFQVTTVEIGKRLSATAIKHQLEEIVKLADEVPTPDYPVNLLTATDRTRGANLLHQLSLETKNEENFRLIRQSPFLICLDRAIPPEQVHQKPERQHQQQQQQQPIGKPTVEHAALQLLHGWGTQWNSLNRWFDSTNQFIISEDGICGMNFEHSVAEGVVLVRLVEEALNKIEDLKSRSDQFGTTTDQTSIKPVQLTWSIPAAVDEQLRLAKKDFEGQISDVQLKVTTYTRYGKNFPKSKNISPDCFIQLVLQLAYYRCHGHLVPTYESASVRRYRQGRVDNIRAAHPAALSWVKSMDQAETAREHCLKDFSAAVDHQQKVMKENITGYGIDNHLVALREISKELEMPMPELFEDEMFHETFQFPMSTSQVPTSIPETFFCYGPVVPHGYGCAYNPLEDKTIFAVSSLKSCEKTNSEEFAAKILACLDDMVAFLDGWKFPDKAGCK